MARPQKEGIDYFPHDVDMEHDDKVALIIAKYGNEGYGILCRLLARVYKNGYWYPWTEKEQLIFPSSISADSNLVSGIINDCIKWDFFNRNMYEDHQILTSKGIQSRYLLATNRRVNSNINHSYCLIVQHNETETVVNVDRNPSKRDNMSAKSTQSKVKESKEIKDSVDAKASKHFAKPSIQQVMEYCQERNNQVDANKWYDFYEANGWKVSKNPMKDWKAAVRYWEKNSPKVNIGTHQEQNEVDYRKSERVKAQMKASGMQFEPDPSYYTTT